MILESDRVKGMKKKIKERVPVWALRSPVVVNTLRRLDGAQNTSLERNAPRPVNSPGPPGNAALILQLLFSKLLISAAMPGADGVLWGLNCSQIFKY